MRDVIYETYVMAFALHMQRYMGERRISSRYTSWSVLHLRHVPTASSCESHTVRAHITVCVCICADSPSITGPDEVFSANSQDAGIELGADDGKPVSLYSNDCTPHNFKAYMLHG